MWIVAPNGNRFNTDRTFELRVEFDVTSSGNGPYWVEAVGIGGAVPLTGDYAVEADAVDALDDIIADISVGTWITHSDEIRFDLDKASAVIVNRVQSGGQSPTYSYEVVVSGLGVAIFIAENLTTEQDALDIVDGLFPTTP